MMDWLKGHLMLWAVPTAAGLTAVQMVTPKVMDFFLAWVIVALVWFVVHLAKSDT